MTETEQPKLVNAGSDALGTWEIWNGVPPLERQRKDNPLMTRIPDGEFAGLYLLEWFW